MPASSVKGPYGETAWGRAKAQVEKEYAGKVSKGSTRYFELVMHIYKSICASPKHDCTPTIRTHPSSRKVETMEKLLNKIEESVQIEEAEELQEMVAGAIWQSSRPPDIRTPRPDV